MIEIHTRYIDILYIHMVYMVYIVCVCVGERERERERERVWSRERSPVLHV